MVNCSASLKQLATPTTVKAYMFFDALESHVVKKGLLGELHLRWTHRIWGEECALELDDKFAKGLA